MARKKGQELSEELLERHVEHELAHWTDEKLLEDLREDVDLAFKAGEALRLRDLIDPDTVNEVIRRQVVERDVPAIIPEMAADFTNDIVGSQFHQNVRPGDLISRERMEEFVDQLLLLKEQRQELIDRLLEQPVYKELVANLLYQGIVRYIYEENLLSKNVPGIGSALRFSSKMLNKAVNGLDEAWEKSVKGYISRNVETMVRQSADFLAENLTDDELKASIMDAWDGFSEKSLSDLQSGLGEVEWSEFVVLGYDFWLAFRKTEYFRQCYETVVESLFQQYGDYSLTTLADEFNIDSRTVMTEVAAILPRVTEALRSNGVLESILRRRLRRFYESDAAQAVLARS